MLRRLPLLLLLSLGPVSPTGSAPPAFLSTLSPGGPAFGATVVAVLPAGPYRYVDLGPAGWAVTLASGEPGEAVWVRPLGRQPDFWSRRLQRRFDSLLFALLTPAPD
jgi:hypothetical protein